MGEGGDFLYGFGVKYKYFACKVLDKCLYLLYGKFNL